jgi:hypothetical protein
MWEFSGVCDNLLETTRNSLILKAERCQSGRLSTLGKRVYGKPYQGFESLSLRHSSTFYCVFLAVPSSLPSFCSTICSTPPFERRFVASRKWWRAIN